MNDPRDAVDMALIVILAAVVMLLMVRSLAKKETHRRARVRKHYQ